MPGGHPQVTLEPWETTLVAREARAPIRAPWARRRPRRPNLSATTAAALVHTR